MADGLTGEIIPKLWSSEPGRKIDAINLFIKYKEEYVEVHNDIVSRRNGGFSLKVKVIIRRGDLITFCMPTSTFITHFACHFSV